MHDILGLFPDFTPRHTRRFAELGAAMREAAQAYAAEVRARTFPSEAQSAKMDAAVIAALREARAPTPPPARENRQPRVRPTATRHPKSAQRTS